MHFNELWVAGEVLDYPKLEFKDEEFPIFKSTIRILRVGYLKKRRVSLNLNQKGEELTRELLQELVKHSHILNTRLDNLNDMEQMLDYVVDIFPIITFGRSAKFCYDRIHKGDFIIFNGEIQSRDLLIETDLTDEQNRELKECFKELGLLNKKEEFLQSMGLHNIRRNQYQIAFKEVYICGMRRGFSYGLKSDRIYENKCLLLGRVCNEPELRYTEEGRPLLNFILYIKRPHSDHKREDLQQDYVNVILWNEMAEKMYEKLRKNNEVLINGRLQSRIYYKEHLPTKEQSYRLDEFLHTAQKFDPNVKDELLKILGLDGRKSRHRAYEISAKRIDILG
ncbi:MAG: single-stranded DNA-binding protein [Halanaerobiales bacterium]|nr:single-stranded DNA-binding protein [Halanaerobiales bacterium]